MFFNHLSYLPLRYAFCLFVSTMTLLSCNMASTTAAYAQNLHAILVADLSPSAEWGKYTGAVAMDITQVSVMLSMNMPESRLQILPMRIEENQDSTPENILAAIESVQVRPEDSLLFYYTGHGAADDQGHYLSLARGKLYRKKLLSALQKKEAKMTTLITDCCNTRSDGYMYAAPAFQVEPPSQPTALFNALFLSPTGVVDIISSSPGESAFFTPVDEQRDEFPSSIFTKELTTWVDQHKAHPHTWDDIVRAVSLRVHNSFHSHYPKGASVAKGGIVQKEQNVFAIQYPGIPPATGPRTGLVVRDFQGKGAVITEVAPKSPATQVFRIDRNKFVTLQPQQVILSINDVPTPTTELVVKQVGSSPIIMKLKIRDVSLGTFDVLLRMKY